MAPRSVPGLPSPASGPVRLAVHGICKTFGATKAVDAVDLVLHGGEMLALVGANGAGKSTLVKIICGAIQADAGRIEVSGRVAAQRSVAEAQAAGIAVAHQQVAIIPCLDGAENIMLGREPRRRGLIDNRALRSEASNLARQFGVSIDLSRECSELSLGETKILDILKAIGKSPAVLILDEPTASLSLAESRQLFGFLADLRRRGLAILFISHHMNEIFQHCDRVAVMKDGRKVFDGLVSSASPGEVVRLMVGRTIEATDWSNHLPPGDVVLKLREGTIGPLAIPELVLRRGEVVGVAGVLGAGQSALLERLAGVPHHSRVAEIVLPGLSWLPRSVGEAIACGICLVADNRIENSLFPGLDVRENLASAALRGFSRGTFVRSRAEASAAAEVIAQLRVKCAGPAQDVMELSGGNQQKVAFGRWLLRTVQAGERAPPLLLLDNPTEGVDVGAKADIYALIRDFARAGAAVLIASSEFAELVALCNRVHCIAHGRLRAAVPREFLTEDRLLLEVA